MKYLIFYWIIIITFFACPEYSIKSCDYTFSIPVTISPAQDTFHTGDTINVKFKFPLQMTNLVDSSIVDMSDFPFQFEAYASWLNYNPILGAEKNFKYIPVIGDINIFQYLNPDGSVPELMPIRSKDSMRMEFNIVLDSTGLVAIGISNLEPLGGYQKYIVSECRAANVNLFFHTNGKSDNNFYLSEFCPDPRIQAISKDVFLNSGGYNFVIVNK